MNKQKLTHQFRSVDNRLHRSRRFRILTTSVAALLAASLFSAPVRGAADNWNGTISTNWNNGANWSGGIPDLSSQVAFPAAVPGTGSTISLSAPGLADTLSFANGYTVTGNTLTLNTGTISVTGTNSVTINSNLAGGNLSLSTSANSTNGPFLFLGGNNTYTGTTSITGGAVVANSNGALSGSGVTVPDFATLFIGAGVTTSASVPVTITGGGVVTPAGVHIGALVGGDPTGTPGASTFSGAITLGGNAIISATTVAASPFNLTGGINNAGNTLFLGINAASPSTPGTINVNSVITGAGNVTVEGQTVNFNAANTYTALDTVIENGGTLNANVAGALPAPPADGGTSTFRTQLIMDDSGSGGSTLGLGANQAISALVGATTSTIALNSHQLTVGEDGTVSVFQGTITGVGGSLVKDTNSTLILTGTNTYTGGTTITAGTLQIGTGASGSIVGDVVDNGVLDFDLGVNTTYSGNISGSGNLLLATTATNISGAALTLGGTNTYTGTTTITQGAIVAASNGALSGSGITVDSGATLYIEPGVTTSASVPVILNGSGIGNGLGRDIGALSGGDPHLGTTGASTFAGAITLNSDAVISASILAGTPFNLTGGINTAGHTLILGFSNSAGGLPTNGTINVNSVITGAGDVTVNSQTVNFNAANTYIGLDTVIENGGTLNANVAGALPNLPAAGGTGTFRTQLIMDQVGGGSSTLNLGADQAIDAVVGAATSTIALNNHQLTIGEDGTISVFQGTITGVGGSLVKDTNGTLVLSGTDTYTGGTTILGGKLSVSNDAALGTGGTVTLNGGTLAITGAITIISHTISLGANGGTVDSTATTVAAGLFGQITGTGPLTLIAGGATNPLVVSGSVDNTLTGLTTIAQGLVDLNGPGHIMLSGDVHVNSGAFLGILSSEQIAPAATVTVDGALVLASTGAPIAIEETIGTLNGSGTVYSQNATGTYDIGAGNFTGSIVDGLVGGTTALVKQGSGTLILTGNNTYSQGTTINGGTLLVNNTAGSGTGTGAVAVIAGGTLGGTGTVGGVINLASGGTIAPGAGSPGVGGSVLHGNGQLNWSTGGTLSLQLGATGDQLSLTNLLEKTTTGLNVNIVNVGMTQTSYTLAKFSGTNTTASDFLLTLPTGFTGSLFESATELDLVNLGFTGSGPIIDNGAPVFTPTFANFIVTGPVVTAGGNNTIQTLTFASGGSLLVNNTLTVTQGPVTLVGGSSLTLNNGTLSASELDMLFGSLLNGNGTINGNLVNGGVVSPGHSPGHINVTGNYSQTPTGLLYMEFAGRQSGQYDLLSVGGTARLGGTLQLVRLDNFQIKRDDKITFLTASGGVIGKFDSVVYDFPSNTIIEPTIAYESNSVVLEGTQGSFEKFASRENLTPNQRAVARGLDSVAFRHNPPKVIDYLDGRSLSELPSDFDKIAPEELTSVFTIGTALATVQSQNIQRRTDDIRSGASGFNAANLAINGDGPSFSGGFDITTGVAGPSGDDGKEVKETKEVVAPAENRWGVFLSGTGEWVSVGNDGNARGYDLQSGGFTLGVDYKFTPNFAVGLMAGYTGTTADLTDHGRIWVNGGKIGLYATFFQNEVQAAPTMSKDSKEVQPPTASIAKGFYADLAVTGGYNSYDTRRSALQGDARGDTDGGELNALFGAGYDFKAGGLTFGPTASFNYTYLGTNGFNESGSLAPLSVHGGNSDSLRSAFGIKASYDWKLGGVVIKPELRAAWQHEYGDAAYGLDSNFANGGGSTFTVNGPKLGRDSALLGAGFAIQCSERCSTYFYYDGELGRKNYQSSSVTGGIRVAF